MKIKGLAGSVIKTAATFFATVVLVCSLAMFAVPATPVAAKVGQPDIPVPALSDVHCASYCVYDKTTGYIVISMNPEDLKLLMDWFEENKDHKLNFIEKEGIKLAVRKAETVGDLLQTALDLLKR